MLYRSILFTACVILPLGLSYAAPTNLYGSIRARSGSTDKTSNSVDNASISARNPNTPKAIAEVAVKYTENMVFWSGGSAQLDVKAKAKEYAKNNGKVAPEMIVEEAGVRADMESLVEAVSAAVLAAEGKVHYVGEIGDFEQDILDGLKKNKEVKEIIQVDPKTGTSKSIYTKPGTSPSKSVQGRSEVDDTPEKTKTPKIKGWYYIQMSSLEGSLINGGETVDKGIPEGLSRNDVEMLVGDHPYQYEDSPAFDWEESAKKMKILIEAARQRKAAKEITAKGGGDTDSTSNKDSSEDGKSSPTTSTDDSDTKSSDKLGATKRSAGSSMGTR